jgi:saccharopine dehydrogenase (NAD+, L-glutamate forming)
MVQAGIREFDVVVFGATGFTGGLTAAELAARAPAGCRWALAGRDLRKLEGVRDGLAADDPSLVDLPLVRADVADPASLRDLAASTRVLITTVGPYLRHGDPVVAACAAEGTDYLDLTGEAEFVDRTWLRHHATAEASGARLVHAAGFDSIPHDLGARLAASHLPADAALTVHGYVRAMGAFSGGTAASALTFLGRVGEGRRAAEERRAAEAPPAIPVELVKGPMRDQGAWSLPFPSLDASVILRSAAALGWGSSFSYSHNFVVGPLPVVPLAVAGVGTVALLAQVGPLRRGLERLVPAGSGPSAEQRAKGHFEVRMVGTGGGRRVVARVAGGDPGYAETSKMLAESALCLAYDELPDVAGQVTTSVAMGEALTARLEAAGITFEVFEEGPAPSA